MGGLSKQTTGLQPGSSDLGGLGQAEILHLSQEMLKLPVCDVTICLYMWLYLHMEVPRLGIKSYLQLPAYATATGSELCLQPMPQLAILNPLSEARDRTCILMETMSGP